MTDKPHTVSTATPMKRISIPKAKPDNRRSGNPYGTLRWYTGVYYAYWYEFANNRRSRVTKSLQTTDKDEARIRRDQAYAKAIEEAQAPPVAPKRAGRPSKFIIRHAGQQLGSFDCAADAILALQNHL